jgi:DNA-binding IclR family transcriptional regulator
MTLREQILELLRQGPQTANGLARALRSDKTWIRTLLLSLERKGLVTCEPKKHGKVTYKFWSLCEETR